ncbi:hypothetical protein [Streptomyces sp. NPDC127114]|uniref:hypothetical protein n=1 Tax=Streptomyces sp. NPDC127114 TaxID=3345366 RepID=UPI0036315653
MNNRNDALFIAYMRAFEESSKHTAVCVECQDGDACAEGDPIHAEFHGLQDAWTKKARVEGKKP